MKTGLVETANFCGESGESYRFERISTEADWAKVAGVILFAAPEGRFWRVIRVGEQGGVSGDINAFWRWREARRYGASAVFVRRDADIGRRRKEAADLTAGLDPVCNADVEFAAAA
jgi:hypothetical protein